MSPSQPGIGGETLLEQRQAVSSQGRRYTSSELGVGRPVSASSGLKALGWKTLISPERQYMTQSWSHLVLLKRGNLAS